MAEPAKGSGAIVAAIVIGICTIMCVILLMWKNRQDRNLQAKIARQFHLRYNAFSAQNDPGKKSGSTDSKSSKGSKNNKYLGERTKRASRSNTRRGNHWAFSNCSIFD